MVEKAALIQSYQDFLVKLLLRKRNMLDISKTILIILVHHLLQTSEKNEHSQSDTVACQLSKLAHFNFEQVSI